jgi:hypothetical protein
MNLGLGINLGSIRRTSGALWRDAGNVVKAVP